MVAGSPRQCSGRSRARRYLVVTSNKGTTFRGMEHPFTTEASPGSRPSGVAAGAARTFWHVRSQCAGSRRPTEHARATSGERFLPHRAEPVSPRGPEPARRACMRRNAHATSPRRASGAATTATSLTCCIRTRSSSISCALMFSPPRMMSFFAVRDRQVAVVVEDADVAGHDHRRPECRLGRRARRCIR